ncbi:MAG: hypothetical protein M1831_007172 [Alyxoria varia]|nr:MAG: hypothetical protein M1831_007172 [Alyxoria varia]
MAVRALAVALETTKPSTTAITPDRFVVLQLDEPEFTAELLHAIQPSEQVRYDGTGLTASSSASAGARHNDTLRENVNNRRVTVSAHKAGVSALAVDRFEGRYVLSGGADASIFMWDLEAAIDETKDGRGPVTHSPVGSVTKSSSTHAFSITDLSFFPMDSGAFLSSSYDHTLKGYDSNVLTPSVNFDVGAKIYSHSISPIASQLLVACGSQQPAIRLVDLRTTASAHALVGHTGDAVISVAWSPVHEYVLASGGIDGTVRFWDVRRGNPMLGVLDMDDSTGIDGHDGLGFIARRREIGKAHVGPVNGLVWAQDGRHIVSVGHDEKVRVWETATAKNTLANFGPTIRNMHLSAIQPIIAPPSLAKVGDAVLFYPNGAEVLMYEMFEGRLLRKMKVPRPQLEGRKGGPKQNTNPRVTAMSWRAHNVEFLTAHSDGTIHSWIPRTFGEALTDEPDKSSDNEEAPADDVRKKKRETLQNIERDLKRPRVTFT